MAASSPRLRNRLLRTYGAAGGWGRRPVRTATQWFPPQDSKRFFSSSSSSNASSDDPSLPDASDDSDDPDFSDRPMGRRRRRAAGRLSKDPPSPIGTPRRLRLRTRPPQKCSTPRSSLLLPPLPSSSLGRLSPDLTVRNRPGDGGELGTSASLFSSPVSPSPGPGSPELTGSVILIDPSASLSATSEVPSDLHLPAAASQHQAPHCCSQVTAPGGGRDTRLAQQARARLFSLMDSGQPEDSEFGADGKHRRESCCQRVSAGKGLKDPGLSSIHETRATGQSPCQATPGAVQRDYEAARGCKSRVVPGETNGRERTGATRKRGHPEAAEPSLLHGRQDLGRVQNDCSWTKGRASFGLHKKKKIVTTAPDVSSCRAVAGSLSESLLSELSDSSVLHRPASAPPPWRSSSMHLLTPSKAPDRTASDAAKVYRECNQEGPVPFSACLSPEQLERCEKIGEGVFGEVFQTIANHTPVALKVIAVEGPDLINGAHQKTLAEILPEIIISKELSLLSSDEAGNRTGGFIGLKAVYCVQGSYPPLLLRAWDRYHSARGSANDRPDFFEEDQLFVVMEFEFGGTDLEQMRRRLPSVATAQSILHQVTASLAVAEASLHFEHRDLHWGNVLLKKTSLKELHYTLHGKTRAIPTRGLQVNIIDYTLSRLERDGIVVFCDVAMDEDLFTGEGDYQFEIYRLMRKENNNSWGEYRPYTNVLWLHYLTDKILKNMTFKTKCNTPALKQVKRKIQDFHRTMLDFSSATDLLCQHSLFK